MDGLVVAAIVLAALVVVASVASGLVRYRRVMRRPWPKVPPTQDEDDW